MRMSGSSLAILAMVCTFSAGAAAPPQGQPMAFTALPVFAAAQAASTASADQPFGKEQLDQMTAPIAL
jgi:hypothetical protein